MDQNKKLGPLGLSPQGIRKWLKLGATLSYVFWSSTYIQEEKMICARRPRLVRFLPQKTLPSCSLLFVA